MKRLYAMLVATVACAGLAPQHRPPAGDAPRSPAAAPWGALVSPATRSYPSELIDGLVRTRRGVGAVVVRGAVQGTGFLVGRDEFLTCRHCIQDIEGTTQAATALTIRLDYTKEASPFERYAVRHIERISERHDLAVLRLAPDPHGRLPAADRVLRVATGRARLHTPVYIWSHALGKPLTIADGGYVSFPHVATARELHQVERRLRRELQFPRAAIADMRSSYQPMAGGRFELISPIWANQPILGIEARVEHGSSGAPVIDKHTHEVIGMLFAGPDRGPHPAASSWHAHDAVLPAAFLR